jgi:dihydrofolate reductase
MRKLIVSIHSTVNDIVTGPPADETNFMVWAQAGIEDVGSLETFLKSLANVDTILLGRATYEDLVRKWPNVKEWPHVSDVIVRTFGWSYGFSPHQCRYV